MCRQTEQLIRHLFSITGSADLNVSASFACLRSNFAPEAYLFSHTARPPPVFCFLHSPSYEKAEVSVMKYNPLKSVQESKLSVPIWDILRRPSPNASASAENILRALKPAAGTLRSTCSLRLPKPPMSLLIIWSLANPKMITSAQKFILSSAN